MQALFAAKETQTIACLQHLYDEGVTCLCTGLASLVYVLQM